MRKLHDIITPEETAFRKTFSVKPRRGRPGKFSEAAVAMMPLRNGTWRGRMNELHRIRAMTVVFPEDLTDSDCEWIFSHKTVLYELGRIESDDDARAIFQQLRKIDPPPTTRRAVAMIRQWRVGHAPHKSLDRIYQQIVKVLEGYDATPESLAVMREALQAALRLVSRAESSIR
jgi:hypothetical protein